MPWSLSWQAAEYRQTRLQKPMQEPAWSHFCSKLPFLPCEDMGLENVSRLGHRVGIRAVHLLPCA